MYDANSMTAALEMTDTRERAQNKLIITQMHVLIIF